MDEDILSTGEDLDGSIELELPHLQVQMDDVSPETKKIEGTASVWKDPTGGIGPSSSRAKHPSRKSLDDALDFEVLRRQIIRHFSGDELRVLFSDLCRRFSHFGTSYDDTPGRTIPAKVAADPVAARPSKLARRS